MKSKIFISMFCMFLIVSLPIVSAQYFQQPYPSNVQGASPYGPFYSNPNSYSTPASFNKDPIFGSSLGGYAYNDPFADAVRRQTGGYSYGFEQNLGEAIIVNVADYEPKQVRQSLLEQQDAPVFVYLKGTTLGTALSPFTNDPSSGDIFSGITQIPRIQYIQVLPNASSKYSQYVRSINYVPPQRERYSLDNLGFLIVYLRKLPSQNATPPDNNIVLDLDAKIYLDLEESTLFGVSEQSLALKISPDEKEFLENKEGFSFFSGKGFVRSTAITQDSVTLQVYNKNLFPISFAPLQQQTASQSQGLQTRSFLRLTKGQVSQPISFGYSGNSLQDFFQVRLDDIATPQDRAELTFEVNGKQFTRKISVGAKIFARSPWVVKSVSARKSEQVTSVNIDKIAKDFNLDSKNREFILKIVSEKNAEGVLNDVSVMHHVADIENQFSDEVKTVTSDVISVNGKPMNINLSPVSDDEAEALEREYCPEDENEDVACNAVLRYKRLLKEYSSSPESKKSMNDLAELYEKKLINYKACFVENTKVLDDCRKFKADMDSLAYYYYSKVDNKDRLKEWFLSKSTPVYLVDEGMSLTLKQVEKIDPRKQGKVEFSLISKEGENDKIESALDERNSPKPEFLSPGSVIEGSTIKDLANVFLPLNMQDIKIPKSKWEWRVERIQPTAVTIRLYNKETNAPAPQDKVSSITLKPNEIVEIPSSFEYVNPTSQERFGNSKVVKIKVDRIETDYEAYITIIPGTGRAFTTSSFRVNIPVDPRPFEWTPEQLESHIKTTRKIIEQLDRIIKKMDDVIKTWKKVCLATFAFLTVKSSFLQGTGRSLARKYVSDSFKERCTQEKIEGRTDAHPEFKTVDRCLNHYSDEIKSSVDSTQKHMGEVQDVIKGKTAQDLADSGLADANCKSFKEFWVASKSSGANDQNIIREYRDCLLNSKVQSDASVDSNYKNYLNEKILAVGVNEKVALYNKAKEIAQASNGLYNPEKEDDVQDIIYSLEQKKAEGFKDILLVRPKIDNDGKKGSVVLGDQPVSISRISQLDHYKYELGYPDENILSQELCERSGGKFSNGKCMDKKSKEIKTESVRQQMEKDQYVHSSGHRIFVPSEFIKNEKLVNLKLNTEIDRARCDAVGVIEGEFCKPKLLASTIGFSDAGFLSSSYSYGESLESFHDENGFPYCYPVGKGDYAVVEEGFKGNKLISKISLWNVGPNGRIECAAGDDVAKPGGHVSALEINTALKSKAVVIGNGLRQCKKGDGSETVGNVDGKPVRCRKSSSETLSSALQPKCIDVMDPSDCKLLFNACDPVMCPGSRCTLGGRVPPRNVIQSGIAGSTLLCLPNIKEGIAVPVCLTGIDAGLKGIRSILQGYVDCLEIKLKQNRDVGFCDYIRSVGICELVWRETYNLLDIGGRGIVDWVSGKVFGEAEGGGEYLKFKSSFDNVGNSVNVFTKEYEATYTAQFLSQSTDEIGTQICRLSVNGKLPSIGKIIDQLTEPEDPPQFEAFFDEAPYASPGQSAGFAPGVFGAQELSLYKVFYHIYAGTGFYKGSYSQSYGVLNSNNNVLIPSVQPGQQRPVSYSVYLVNRQSNLPPLSVTFPGDFAVQTQGTIEPGKYAQQTVQKPAIKGYNEVCVNINGVEQCGFGKVSSSFGIKEANDFLTASEAKEEIKSVDQCSPNQRRSASYSLAKLAAASPFAAGLATPTPTVGLLTSNAEQGLLSTGIIRVCSNTEPTPEPGRWKDVGTCGKNAQGRDLGDCWLDTHSINIDDAEVRSDLFKALAERGDIDKAITLLDKERSREILYLLNEQRNSLLLALRNLLENAKKGKASATVQEKPKNCDDVNKLYSSVGQSYSCQKSTLSEAESKRCITGPQCDGKYCCGKGNLYCCPAAEVKP